MKLFIIFAHTDGCAGALSLMLMLLMVVLLMVRLMPILVLMLMLIDAYAEPHADTDADYACWVSCVFWMEVMVTKVCLGFSGSMWNCVIPLSMVFPLTHFPGSNYESWKTQ